VEKNLRTGLANGLTAEPAWEPSLYLRALASMDANTEFVSLGGSSVPGSLGYVDAAAELAKQVSTGAMPEPDEIVVALGSGGTAAGLLVGLEKAGLRAKVVGVSIAKPVFVVKALAVRLTSRVARTCEVNAERALARLVVDETSVGAGYGHETAEGQRALTLAAAEGIKVDQTYTAKALASALARAREDEKKTVLFWNTLSSTAPTLTEGELHDRLPEDLGALLRGRPRELS
jgi:D-cysteine desulfhydrase